MAQDASIDAALQKLDASDQRKLRKGIMALIRKMQGVAFGNVALRLGMQNARINTCHADESEAIQ